MLLGFLLIASCAGEGSSASGEPRTSDRPSVAVTRHVDDSTPAACEALGVADGAALDGADLLTCLEDSLRATRSGRLVMNPAPDDQGPTQVLTFVHDGDDLVVGRDSPGAYVAVGDRAWVDVDDDGTWVRSDPEGSGAERRAAELVPMPDSRMDSLVPTAPNMPGTTWDVQPATDADLATTGGEAAWRVSSRPGGSGARAISQHVVLLDAGLAPLRVWASGMSGARPVTVSYAYTSLGEPMELVVPE